MNAMSTNKIAFQLMEGKKHDQVHVQDNRTDLAMVAI